MDFKIKVSVDTIEVFAFFTRDKDGLFFDYLLVDSVVHFFYLFLEVFKLGLWDLNGGVARVYVSNPWCVVIPNRVLIGII